MGIKIVKPSAAHVAFRDEAIVLLKKHIGLMSAEEALAMTAHLVGQTIALQDQRVTTPEKAMAIVMLNIEKGNDEAIEALMTAQWRG